MTYRELMEQINDMAPHERDLLEVYACNDNNDNIKVLGLKKIMGEYYLEIEDIDTKEKDDEIDRLNDIINYAINSLTNA